MSAVDCSAVSVSDEQDLPGGHDAATHLLRSADSGHWQRSVILVCYSDIRAVKLLFSCMNIDSK